MNTNTEYEQYQISFLKSKKFLERFGLQIHKDGSSLFKFSTKGIIDFLNNEKGHGLYRLQGLSILLNMEGLDMVDYDGSSVNKWAREHEHLFGDLDEDDKLRITSCDACVYVNHYGKKSDVEMNKYCEEEGDYTEEQITKAKKHKDGMMWYWLGEY